MCFSSMDWKDSHSRGGEYGAVLKAQVSRWWTWPLEKLGMLMASSIFRGKAGIFRLSGEAHMALWQ